MKKVDKSSSAGTKNLIKYQKHKGWLSTEAKHEWLIRTRLLDVEN